MSGTSISKQFALLTGDELTELDHESSRDIGNRHVVVETDRAHLLARLDQEARCLNNLFEQAFDFGGQLGSGLITVLGEMRIAAAATGDGLEQIFVIAVADPIVETDVLAFSAPAATSASAP